MTSNLTDPPAGVTPPTIAFAQPGPDGQRYRTIRVPDYGPNVEILTLHWPIARELLTDDTLDLARLAHYAAQNIAGRVQELITEWKPA